MFPTAPFVVKKPLCEWLKSLLDSQMGLVVQMKDVGFCVSISKSMKR